MRDDLIVGWESLAKYLNVCRLTAKTMVKVRGFPPGKLIKIGRHYYRVWELKDLK